MFPARYFPSRYYNGRYWAKTGSSAVVEALAMCGSVLVRAVHLARATTRTAHEASGTAQAAHKGKAGFGCPVD